MAPDPTIDEEVSAAIDVLDLDEARGRSLLEALANEGRPSAIFYLALYLGAPYGKAPADHLAAEHWLRIAAEAGSGTAAWNLAIIEQQREGTIEMRKWIDRAADFGDEDAIKVKLLDYDIEVYLHELREPSAGEARD